MLACTCGKAIDETKIILTAENVHSGEEIQFCSRECRKNWVIGKIIWMCISLVIGIVLATIISIEVMAPFAIPFFMFIPYMIRNWFAKEHDLSGVVGEVLTFFVIFLGAITLVYPIYKLVREIQAYVYVFKDDKEAVQ